MEKGCVLPLRTRLSCSAQAMGNVPSVALPPGPNDGTADAGYLTVSAMETHAREWAGGQSSAVDFLFLSVDPELERLLAQGLGAQERLRREPPDERTLASLLAALEPAVVFLDFSMGRQQAQQLGQAVALAQALHGLSPSLPRVAVGDLSQPDGAVAALRAGVRDFIDPRRDPAEIRGVVRRLLNERGVGPGGGALQRSLLVLGATAGAGASTVAVQAARLAQQQLGYPREGADGHAGTAGQTRLAVQRPMAERACLLDLGWPRDDSLRYLDLSPGYDCARLLHDLPQMDGALLANAMDHTPGGIAALGLPAGAQRPALPPHEAHWVSECLRRHYGLLVIDAGGIGPHPCIPPLAFGAQETWVVTDQSAAAQSALVGLLQALDGQMPRHTLRLVVNRYDPACGPDAQEIAAQQGIVLACTLSAHAAGAPPAQDDMAALNECIEGLLRDPPAPSREDWLAAWLPGVHTRLMA